MNGAAISQGSRGFGEGWRTVGARVFREGMVYALLPKTSETAKTRSFQI